MNVDAREHPGMVAQDSDFELAAQASELYLSGSWLMAAGMPQEAARKLHSAARLWHEAASAMSSRSETESIRQRMNRVVALFESGDIPQAQAAAQEVDQAIARATTVSAAVQRALTREWNAVKFRKQDVLQRWQSDWAKVQREAKSPDRLDRLPRALIDLLLARYPGLPRAHYLAYLYAERRGRYPQAKNELLQALHYDPGNDTLATLLLGVISKVDPPDVVVATAAELFDRFKETSARFAYMYSLTLLREYEVSGRRRSALLPRAAEGAAQAVKLSSGNLTNRAWAWANVVHQYCRWRLREPGVECPSGIRYYRRGVDIVAVEVPPIEDAKDAQELLERVSREAVTEVCA